MVNIPFLRNKRIFNKYFSQSRQAQQLVEFALALPILMIFIFIVVEMATAINARATIAEAVKQSLMDVNSLNNLGGDYNGDTVLDGNTTEKIARVETIIENKVIQYLINHNVSNSASINVRVTYNATNNTAIAFVSYQYNPYFLMSGMFAGAIPNQIVFSSSQSLNPNIFKPNVFPTINTRSTKQLSEYFTNGSTSASNLMFLESGALVDTTAYNPTDAIFNVREHIAFLVSLYGGPNYYPYLTYQPPAGPTPPPEKYVARLVDWEGNDLLPPNLRINIQTGTLETKSPYYQGGIWFNTNIPYVWVASALGFTHLIYTKYNTRHIYITEETQTNYKCLFKDTDPLHVQYHKEIKFCGTVAGTGTCNGDQRNTATINERALRMNPLLGDPDDEDGGVADYPDNSYLIGTMEPIYITNSTHEFRYVKGFYFSYSSNYLSWNGSDYINWDTTDNYYFMSIASPRVTSMPDAVYNNNLSTVANNPFYQIFNYSFFLDANGVRSGAGTAIDIVDVYIDSDGDSIPDAWDRDPRYFDVNINGKLDGNEKPGTDMTTEIRCKNQIDLNSVNAVRCNSFADTNSTPPNPRVYSSSPVYWISTPYKLTEEGGGLEGNYTSRYLPQFKESHFYQCDADGNFEDTKDDQIVYHREGTDYIRKYVTWWDLSAAARTTAKANFVHGTAAGIKFSPEFQYFMDNDIFDTNSKVYRTAPGW